MEVSKFLGGEKNFMFYKKVDLRRRKDMIDFLENHYRYPTSRWNKESSYANNVKIYNLGLTPKQLEKAYELIEEQWIYDMIQEEIFEEFAIMHNYQWQIGFNGRNNGYLVLYKGGYKVKKYFDFKDGEETCYSDRFRKWFTLEEAKKHPCWDKTYFEPYIVGGGVDMEETLRDWVWDYWHIDDLRDRARLVMEFDKTCDKAVELFKAYCTA